MYRCFYQGLVIAGRTYSIGEAIPEDITYSILQALLRTRKIVPEYDYQAYLAAKLAGQEPVKEVKQETATKAAVEVSTKKK